jgi:hypothetical protein
MVMIRVVEICIPELHNDIAIGVPDSERMTGSLITVVIPRLVV